MKTEVLLIVAATCLWHSTFESTVSQANAVGVPQVLRAANGSYSAKFTLRKLALPKGEEESWWGASWETGGPQKVLTKIEIMHGKKKVFIPASAWSGIGEVRSLAVFPSKSGCEVKFEGGDTHAHYLGSLVVKGQLVTSRTIRHGEFRDEYFETTKYSYVPDDGR